MASPLLWAPHSTPLDGQQACHTIRRMLETWLPREAWRRNQIAVTTAAAMIFLGFTLVTPFLPFYIESIGVRGEARIALWSGLLLSVSPLLAAILGPLWGRLADRLGM